MTSIERKITPEKREMIGNIKVLVFDLYDTVFDLNGTIREKVAALGRNIDPDQFTNAWRNQYGTLMDAVRKNVGTGSAYVELDGLMRRGLVAVLSQFGITDFTTDNSENLMDAWYHPKTQDDSKKGLILLQDAGFILGTMSNASEKMQTEMLKTIGIKFDHIFSSDKIMTYKPDPKMFQQALSTNFSPEQIMMVANYPGDLLAAGSSEVGFRTAYIYRSEEAPSGFNFDLVVKDFTDLAELLSA